MPWAAGRAVLGQAADNIFSAWISPIRLLMLKKPLKSF